MGVGAGVSRASFQSSCSSKSLSLDRCVSLDRSRDFGFSFSLRLRTSRSRSFSASTRRSVPALLADLLRPVDKTGDLFSRRLDELDGQRSTPFPPGNVSARLAELDLPSVGAGEDWLWRLCEAEDAFEGYRCGTGSVRSYSSSSVRQPPQQSAQLLTSQLKQNRSIRSVEQNIMPRLARFILFTSEAPQMALRCEKRWWRR